MTSPLYSELPQELLLDVEPMRPAGGDNEQNKSLRRSFNQTNTVKSNRFIRFA